ncbi:MAG TPA: hypothetical protein VMY77_01780 [Chitinophagaceae bacterium]|nr:hypothetical protein [Chitinophagaceae bacterium]
MVLKSISAFILLIAVTLSAEAQKIKVKRKGVTPLEVTKNTDEAGKLPDTPPTYSLRQLTGKWQEVRRETSRTNSQVSFNDTLFYTFSGRGEVNSRDGVNMSLMGEALIEPGNVLVAAADVFTIKSMNNHQVVLDDGEYLHTLVRKSNFWHETLPTNAVAPEKFTNPVPVSTSALAGKWKVYRRAAQPGTTDKVLIRVLNVQEIKNDNTATGEIMFYKTEKLETLPCTITLNGEKMQISTEKNIWNVNVYKADGKDLVFGDASLMYYCKPL